MATGQYSLTDVDTPPSGKFSLNDIDQEQQQPEQPGIISRTWSALNTPLIPQGRAEKEGLATATSVPTLAESEHPVLTGIKKGLAGAYADTLGTVRGFTSPVGLATLGMGAVARAVPKIAPLARAVQTGAGLVFGGQGAGQVIGAGTENTPEAWQQRLQGASQVAAGAAGGADAFNQGLPSFNRAAQHFQSFEAAYGDRPVAATRTAAKAQALADRIRETNLTSVPGPVQALLDKVSGGEQPKIAGMDATEFQRRAPEAYQKMADAGAITPPEPLTVQQARHLRTDLNTIIFDRNTPSQFKGDLQKIAQSLHQETTAALPTQSAKNWYLATNKEWNRAESMQRNADKIGPAAGTLIGGIAGKMLGHGLTGMGEGALVGGWAGKQLLKPVIGGMVDSVLNRKMGAVTPPPGAIESVMQAAKDGTISPGKATTILSNMGVSTKVNPPKWAKYWTKDTYPDTGSQ